jgi:uncharacterized damage-inducible protein DinB
MMEPDFATKQYQTLFAYHAASMRRLLDAAGQLADAAYRENPGYGHGSIHNVCVHLLTALRSWNESLITGQQGPRLRAEDYPDLAAVRAGLEAEWATTNMYVAGLSAADIEAVAQMRRRNGEVSNMPRWRVMLHMVAHGLQHQSELAHLLTLKGQSPGDLDFILFDG